LPHFRVASSFSTALSLSCTPVITDLIGATLEYWNRPEAKTVASDALYSPPPPHPPDAEPRLDGPLIRIRTGHGSGSGSGSEVRAGQDKMKWNRIG
jgi:hypothetical protein